MKTDTTAGLGQLLKRRARTFHLTPLMFNNTDILEASIIENCISIKSKVAQVKLWNPIKPGKMA
jgi:hypothetical protein